MVTVTTPKVSYRIFFYLGMGGDDTSKHEVGGGWGGHLQKKNMEVLRVGQS